MPKDTFVKLVKAHGGWMKGDMARFPSVDAKLRFEAALRNAVRKEYDAKYGQSYEEIG